MVSRGGGAWKLTMPLILVVWLVLQFSFNSSDDERLVVLRTFSINSAAFPSRSESESHHKDLIIENYQEYSQSSSEVSKKASTSKYQSHKQYGQPTEKRKPKKDVFRIWFVKEGRCLGLHATKLEVKFCNPNEDDTFTFENGLIKSQERSLCIGTNGTKILELVDCTVALKFSFYIPYKLKADVPNDERELCLTALQIVDNTTKPTNRPWIGAKVGIAKCSDKGASTVSFFDEEEFQKDRSALRLPMLQNSTLCDFPACGINRRVPPVTFLPKDEISRCVDFTECVTVVTKTARRPLFALRLAKSIREVFKVDLPMVVIDDGAPDYTKELMVEIAKYPNMNYVFSNASDLGIGAGRTMGVEMVKTKYFLLLDDDTVVNNRTNVSELVEILDSTDATLAGGGGFQGLLRFQRVRKKGALFQYRGSCVAANQTLEGYPQCFRCDITSNYFLAKTKDVLETSGWSKELKIIEHQDFFLRLKAAGKKVVYCKNFSAENRHSAKGVDLVGGLKRPYYALTYSIKRYYRIEIMTRRFLNHWNIEKRFIVDNKPEWIYGDHW